MKVPPFPPIFLLFFLLPYLLWHTGIGSTLPLAEAHVPSLPARLLILADTSAGVNVLGLFDDEAILDKLADVLACGGSSWVKEEASDVNKSKQEFKA